MKLLYPTLLTLISLFISKSLSLTHQYAQPIRIPQPEGSVLSRQSHSNNTLSLIFNEERPPNSHGNLPLSKRQVAAGGGIASPIRAVTPYPTVSNAASLIVIGTSTTLTFKMFTQTFAPTALGTWALGPTPKVGTIGLGKIQGTVGVVKNIHKRATQTPTTQV